MKSVLDRGGGMWGWESGGEVLRWVKIRWSARPDCISIGCLWIRHGLVWLLWDRLSSDWTAGERKDNAKNKRKQGEYTGRWSHAWTHNVVSIFFLVKKYLENHSNNFPNCRHKFGFNLMFFNTILWGNFKFLYKAPCGTLASLLVLCFLPDVTTLTSAWPRIAG